MNRPSWQRWEGDIGIRGGIPDVLGTFWVDFYSLTETGAASTDYTLVERDTTNKTVAGTGDSFTGSDTSTTTGSNTSSIVENGSNADGSFTLTKTVQGSQSNTTTGDDITGGYAQEPGYSDSTSTAIETNTHTAGGSSSFTETVTDNVSLSETGNSVTGDYTRGVTETLTTTDNDAGSDASGTFAVTESSTQTNTGTQTGNYIATNYTLSQTAYDRTVTGSGTYTAPGPIGVTVPGSSYSYETMETANAKSAYFNQTQTGTTRYGILERYNDVSNTSSGNTPGNMNFVPYGQPFVDPNITVVVLMTEDASKLAIGQAGATAQEAARIQLDADRIKDVGGASGKEGQWNAIDFYVYSMGGNIYDIKTRTEWVTPDITRYVTFPSFTYPITVRERHVSKDAGMYQKGCFGLATLRLGKDPYEATDYFTNVDDAAKKAKAMGPSARVFVIQSNSLQVKAIGLADQAAGDKYQSRVKVLDREPGGNHATWHQTGPNTGYWEWLGEWGWVNNNCPIDERTTDYVERGSARYVKHTTKLIPGMRPIYGVMDVGAGGRYTPQLYGGVATPK